MRRFASAVVLFLLAALLSPGARAADASGASPLLVAPRTFLRIVPTSASLHGNAGTFFHTDLWAVNRSYTDTLTVSALYMCFAGPCPATEPSATITLAPRESKLLPDVGATLFGQPETAGTIQLTYVSASDDLQVNTRTYTPSVPSPTNGTSIPALPFTEMRLRAAFPGVAHAGGSLEKGFRTNAGVFNIWASTAHVTFTLLDSAGAVLGSASADVPSFRAVQVNDVFGAAGAGSVVTQNATLEVTSSAPVFHFTTVIDNQSGDSIFVPAQDAAAPLPGTELVTNGSFDSGVSSWSTVPNLALAWFAGDASGRPSSGAAQLTNTHPLASNGGTSIGQCVAVTPGTVLTVRARTFIPSGQAAGGSFYVAAGFSSSSNCAGIDIPDLYAPSAGYAPSTQDTWMPLGAIGTVPAGARSALIYVQLTKVPAGGSLTGYVDDISAVVSSR